jgi:hypothetical protein
LIGGRKITYSLRIHLDLHVVSKFKYSISLEELGLRLSAFKKAGVEHVVIDMGDLPAEEHKHLMRQFMNEIAPTI